MAHPNPNQPPSPPESPSPNGDAAGSSPASSTGSSSSRGGASSLFIADPGPAFDARQAAEQPAAELAPAPAVLDIAWEEDTVRSILTAEGAAVHTLVGVAEDDWAWLEHELDAIVPPLTRILNRYPTTRAAAGAGDEAAVVIALGGHVTRSYIARKAELAARLAEQQPEPVTGVHAPEGTGPEHDPVAAAAAGGWTTGGA